MPPLDGVVLTAAFTAASLAAHPLVARNLAQPVAARAAGYTDREEAEVKARLRGLGYL